MNGLGLREERVGVDGLRKEGLFEKNDDLVAHRATVHRGALTKPIIDAVWNITNGEGRHVEN